MKKLFLLCAIAICCIYISNETNVVDIPYSSIRIRVIASSNTQKDQENKIIVKSYLEEALKNILSVDDKKSYLEEKLSNDEEIKTGISNVLFKNDIKSSFSTNFGYNYFPEKKMKNLIFPSGTYKSYVVTLGEGNGENWWCVIYPPLCLIDETESNYQYKMLVSEIISKYE